METNHSAIGDPSDDDVFGPVQDGEEVFEWIDDQTGAGEPDEPAARRPAPTFRERLAAARSGGRRLLRSRREIAAALAALVLACAVGGACTAWFDTVAGAADRASVVRLAVDSVVDGDPATWSYNSSDFSAAGRYVAEVANNSPDAVVLDSVSIDAGTMMTSTGWKPVGGSARIPGGGTAKVALAVKLFCPMVDLSRQAGMFGAADGSAGGLSQAFPPLHVRVRDTDGDLRDLVLPTRVTTSSQVAAGNDGLTFRSPDGRPVPRIVSADVGTCDRFTAERTTQRLAAGSGAARFPSAVVFDYVKVVTPATQHSFTLGFTVKNTSSHTETLARRTDMSFLDESRLRTDWFPTSLELAPGQSASARLTVDINDCTSILIGAPVLGETMLEETDDTGASPPRPVFIDQALTGSLRLAGDIVEQEKAACS